MAAPTLKPLDISEPLGTPAAEWAQQTVEAIDPATTTTTGLVTDAHGNPTTDHGASALGGAPGHGVNADKTAVHLEAVASNAPKPSDLVPLLTGNGAANGGAHAPGAGAFTDVHGNPIVNQNASVLDGAPLPSSIPGHMGDSTATTPVQLPGGWIRSAGSRQHSMAAPETSLYEDVSAALGTVGQAAFSALPASVIGNLSHNPEQGGANPAANATTGENGAPKTGVTGAEKATPPRSSSPGIISRAQGMLSGLLARPASPSPAQKLPAPDAPTTTGGGPGDAALIGGGAIASTAEGLGNNIASESHPAPNNVASESLPAPDAPTTIGGGPGDAALVGGGAVASVAEARANNIASGQDLGGHDPKGVLEGEQPAANLLSEGTARRTGMPEGANTAARFMDPNVATPDVEKPPHDPGLAGSVFPTLADDPKKSKGKFKPAAPGSAVATSPTGQLGSTLSPDEDVQAAASRSNQDFSTAVPTSGVASTGSKPDGVSDRDRVAPTVTKVSDSGVLGRLLDARDVVVAPFAGSRAPQSPDEAPGTANVDQTTKKSANSEGIRTTENPHTPHTALAPPREEGTHVGGTGVVSSQTTTGGADGKNLDGTTGRDGKDTGLGAKARAGSGASATSAAGDLTHVPGVSAQGGGEGKVVAHEDGAIKPADSAHSTGNGTAGEKDKEGKGVSRLWSRSRTSVDGGSGRRRASVDDASKSPTGSRRNKNTSASRFNEESAGSPGSDAGSAPGSPSSSRFKVPLKDKLKGELKIISGKISRNEAKVEQGIALKTGHVSDSAVSPK